MFDMVWVLVTVDLKQPDLSSEIIYYAVLWGNVKHFDKYFIGSTTHNRYNAA